MSFQNYKVLSAKHHFSEHPRIKIYKFHFAFFLLPWGCAFIPKVQQFCPLFSFCCVSGQNFNLEYLKSTRNADRTL